MVEIASKPWVATPPCPVFNVIGTTGIMGMDWEVPDWKWWDRYPTIPRSFLDTFEIKTLQTLADALE